MPQPKRLFQFFTDAELAAALAVCVEQMTSGAFTSLSGAQKSSSVEWMSLSDRLDAINAEKNARNGTGRAQKVESRLFCA